MAKPKVVVGVDGSEPAAAALRWASREAAARGVRLVVVMAWDLLGQPHLQGVEGFDRDYDEGKALDGLAGFVTATIGPEAAHDAELEAPCDLSARALLDTAEGDDLLVVGSRGLGGFKGLLLGSVSDQVVHHATGPVVVVPRDVAQWRGRIVVGVDGSAASIHALTWGIAEARRWEATVEAVTVWPYPYGAGLPFSPVVDPADVEKGAARALEDAVAQACAGGGFPVERSVVPGVAARELRERASGASLLVVGNRGRGGFAGLLLGSVSSQCARHAPCPTAVIRAGA